MVSMLPENLFETLAVFLTCAGIIGFSGTRLAAVADQLADRAGLGEALMGGVLLGAVTSISGSVLSVSASKRSLSQASEALETSSRRKISLFE